MRREATLTKEEPRQGFGPGLSTYCRPSTGEGWAVGCLLNALNARLFQAPKAPASSYSSSAPRTLPVCRWTMWTCLQARQVTPS